MKHMIIESLQGLSLATPQTAAGLSIIPLLASRPTTHHYLSLRQALHRSLIVITEISEGGSVPSLKVTNKAADPVLILDGEELKGAKQNRILNTTVLVPPQCEIIIPVSCTERGRWHHVSSKFDESENVMPSEFRAQKLARVLDNLKLKQSFDADQGEIWRNIDQLQSKHRVHSVSSAMSDVFDEKRRSLDEVSAHFTLMPEQIGIYVEVSGRFTGLDMVSLPEAWKDVHDKIIRSYLIDHLRRDIPDQAADPNRLKGVIDDLEKAEFLPFKAVGLGDDLRIEFPSLTGSFLVWADQTVHCAIYPRRETQRHETYHSPRNRTSDIDF